MLEAGQTYKLLVSDVTEKRSRSVRIDAKVLQVEKHFVVVEKQRDGKKLYSTSYFLKDIKEARVI